MCRVAATVIESFYLQNLQTLKFLHRDAITKFVLLPRFCLCTTFGPGLCLTDLLIRRLLQVRRSLPKGSKGEPLGIAEAGILQTKCHFCRPTKRQNTEGYFIYMHKSKTRYIGEKNNVNTISNQPQFSARIYFQYSMPMFRVMDDVLCCALYSARVWSSIR